jgi:hypothetical protein
MKKIIIVIFLLTLSVLATQAQTPKWGVGLRVGEPLGLTVKRYLPQGRAWEFNLGSSGFYGYNHQKAFYRYDRFKDYEYRRHYLQSALGVQFRYLVHKSVGLAEAPGLEWYYGAGGQLRSYQIDYEYRVRIGNDWEPVRERINNIDLGVDGILGMEYSWREVPLTVFLDVNLFLEIVDSPFAAYLQGGTGVRYYF